MSTNTEYEHDRALMFRLYIDPDANQALFSWMDVWLTNFAPWETERHGTNDVPVLTTDESGAQYYTADWWFNWDEDKAQIYDNLLGPTENTGYVFAYSDWARIGYHDCTHPSGAGACVWNEVREFGPVPDSVPGMTPPDEHTGD